MLFYNFSKYSPHFPGVEAQGAASQGPGIAQRGEALGLHLPDPGDLSLEHEHAAFSLRGPVLGERIFRKYTQPTTIPHFSVTQYPDPAAAVRNYQSGTALVQNSCGSRYTVLIS